MYWQCRIRQESVRKLDGRPTAGMRPTVLRVDTRESLGTINVLITKREPADYTSQFRHTVKKTQDPAERIKSGLQLLAEAYYQQPKGFSTELVALFALDSELAGNLLSTGECNLAFAQDTQKHRLHCTVREVPEDDLAHQAIYWHNHLFNPRMPGRVRVLGFTPQ